MAGESLMVKQVQFISVVSKVKILAVAIIVGITAIYGVGLFVAGRNVLENFEVVNIATLALLIAVVPLSIYIKKILLRKATLENFKTTYFTAHIIPFAMIDFAGLFCITTNLFVNSNTLYASIAVAIAVGGMILNFPKEEDFEKIKNGWKFQN
ncbi:MAG: hypothetical protein SGI89_07650 [bacterium]|nr:hypothetical protein [bacterium]